MPFHFKKTEPPATAIRRVCREHIGEARANLRKSRHPASVHRVRKEIKKLRALFRLVRGGNDRGAYRRMEKKLRRAAGQLAAPRDARVRFETLGHMAGRNAARQFPTLHKALLKDCRRESRRFHNHDSVALVERILRRTGKRVAGLKFATAGWAAIEPGLRQSYLRGQQAGGLARREPSSEHLHAWRKQVKIFWHQLRMVCPRWPVATRFLTNDLEQLGKLLGQEHDLALLGQFAAEYRPATEAAALNRLITARQKKLREAALKWGAKLFKILPATLCQQLSRDWRAWHGRDRNE